jgi:phenylalanine ammonia-lyase
VVHCQDNGANNITRYNAAVKLTDDPLIRQRLDESVSLLKRELESSTVYGVNTGFGGSADTRTQNFEELQSAAIQHLNVGILLQADKAQQHDAKTRPNNPLLRSHALPAPIVRAAMLIRCNSLVRGHSGVRASVIDAIVRLLALDMTPIVPLRGSISASGDLSTLSYIAGVLEGNPDISVRVGGGGESGEPRLVSADAAMKAAGLDPIRLQAKEGLGITNGTAPSCATACIVVHQANQLALFSQLLTAMATEALNGTADNYHPFISAVRSHPGQAEVAANILAFLAGSKISPTSRTSDSTLTSSAPRAGLAQDRYALRTAPQWLGPQIEDLQLAARQVAIEVNSTTDNPLLEIFPGEEGSMRLRTHHGGNFQAAAITSAMEKTLTALQNVGRLLFAQSSEIINHATNRGLPPNLSFDDPSRSFIMKGFDVNMAAYAAELGYLARPISAYVHAAEMANQSVNSMALVAARYALEAVELVALMAATHTLVLCQALDLRCLRIEFGQRVNSLVRSTLVTSGILADTVQNGERQDDALVGKISEAILNRWDQLTHLDLSDRCRTAVGESLGRVLEYLEDEKSGGGSGLSLDTIRSYRSCMTSALERCYNDLRTEFIRRPTTTNHISPASRAVYDFVRKELGIPLNRGVEDHPPLLLRNIRGGDGASQGHAFSNDNGVFAGPGRVEEDLEGRARTLGTMASEIYEALRRGDLHDRIMAFGQRSGFWGVDDGIGDH